LILLDRNFESLAQNHDETIVRDMQQNINKLPIEKTRLHVSTSFRWLGLPYCYHLRLGDRVQDQPCPHRSSWFFFLGHWGCSSLNTMIVDLHSQSLAKSTALSNLVCCLHRAGATATAIPMINAMGAGWAGTFAAAGLMTSAPFLWLVYDKGWDWDWRHGKIGQDRSREQRAQGSVST
jgi:hypothetical protein